MLMITRKQGDSILLDTGDTQIEITVMDIGKQIRLGINAPESCKIWRKELYLTMQENKQAVDSGKPKDIRGVLRQIGKQEEACEKMENT